MESKREVKIITVIGVTGKQGSSVAKHFLESSWHVRGITRNAKSEKAKDLVSKGMEVIEADLSDQQSLVNAFIGSHVIFTVTDYVSNIHKIASDATLQAKAKELGKSLQAYAGDLEKTQGINAATAAADPKVLATLERYVFSTLPAVSKLSNGKYSQAYEFDAKAAAEEHIRQTLPALTDRMSTVTMGNYLENWPYITVLAPQKEKDGSYSFLWLDCPGEHTAHPELWVTQDAGLFVKALVLDHPPGTSVLASTAIIGSADYAAMWSKVMGLPAQSKVVSEEEYAALVPEEIRAAFVELIKAVTEYGVPGVKTAQELGIQPSPLEDFIKAQQWVL